MIGGEPLVHVANLADPVACTGAVDAAVARFGRLDALCNIAGLIRMAHSHLMSRADFELTLAVNFAAPWHLSQAAIPHLLETDGAIVNCASSAAFIGEAYATAYAATKAALVSMTKSLAMEYQRQPIRINAVAPGGMQTNISVNMAIPEDVDRELLTRYMGMRGMVELEDVAEAVAMLASPAGRSYHGATISIDAGITAG
jgi:NAD(P)-dependent dehydrogenase (short-subunit alcohol dehydrogenase family)